MRYDGQKNKHGFVITKDEIKIFIAFLIFSGVTIQALLAEMPIFRNKVFVTFSTLLLQYQRY